MRTLAPLALLLACSAVEPDPAPFAPADPEGGLENPCGGAPNDLDDLSDEEWIELDGEYGGFSCDWDPGGTVKSSRFANGCEVAWWECGPGCITVQVGEWEPCS